MPILEAMKNYLLAGTTTLNVFLKLTAKDGDVLTIHNGTRNKKLPDGLTYYAVPLAPSRLQATNGLKPDNFEVMTILAGLYSAAVLRSGKWRGGRVEYRVMNRHDFTMGPAERRKGFIGETRTGRFTAKWEFKSLSQKLQEAAGFTANADCDVVELGDSRCQVDLDGFTADANAWRISCDAHITNAINRQQFTVEFDETPQSAASSITNDLYHRGKAVITSGNNDGVNALVFANEDKNFTLWLPLFYDLQVDDTLTLITGCNRSIDHCFRLYNNAINNRSFFMLPGRSKLLKIPD